MPGVRSTRETAGLPHHLHSGWTTAAEQLSSHHDELDHCEIATVGEPELLAPGMRALIAAGELYADEIAATLRVSRRTLFRGLANARAHDEVAAGK
jgi:hypothetical protein